MFGPANGLSLALSAVSVLIAGVTVLLAYFDVRRLRATGFERPASSGRSRGHGPSSR